jgi:hypothetical protein
LEGAGSDEGWWGGDGEWVGWLVGDERGLIVVERTLLPMGADWWMTWQTGGSAAPAGAGL